jgi:predicted RNA binding protein YcfA (HicA-like mRNA interferase family)
MAKASAIYERMQRSPQKALRFRDFERVLVAFGYGCVRQRGSHRVFEHPAVPRPLIIQPRRSDAKPTSSRSFLIWWWRTI